MTTFDAITVVIAAKNEEATIADVIAGCAPFARDTIVVWLGEGRLTTARVEGALTVVPIVPGKMEYLPRGTVTVRQVSAGDPRAMVFEIK